MTVAHELHASGEPHLHAFIQFKKVERVRNCSFFDLFGAGKKVWHGNYEPTRNAKASFDYVRKDDDYVSRPANVDPVL